MISFNYNKALGVLETKIEGDTSINDIIKYIIDVREHEMLSEKIKIFTDASKGKFIEKVRKNDLQRFLDENKKTLAQKELIYDAFVVSGSFETALGLLYQELIKVPNYQFKIFSTKEAAINWLNKF
jgi:hypothetical protein